MGFKDNIQLVRYQRHAQKLTEANKFILSNADLKCKYCDAIFENADNVKATDYLDHLLIEHRFEVDRIEAEKHKERLDKIFQSGFFSKVD